MGYHAVVSYTEIISKLELLRARYHHEASRLSHDDRRHLLEEMEALADQLSYDDSDSGCYAALRVPTVPPRHNRMTTSSGSHPIPPELR